MDLNYQNQRKKNKKNVNSFNMSNATKTFKKLVEKHNKEEKLRNKKIYYNKTDEFFNSLNNKFFKEEIKETDIDYIFKEIKNQIKINQSLVDHFGINAAKKSMPYSRDPIRFDKKLLFNPLKYTEENETRYASFDSKNKEEKFLTLPSILKKNIKIINPRKNSEQLLLFKKLESNRDIKDIKFKESKSMNKYNKLKTESSNFNDSNNNNNLNYNYTFSNERYTPIKSYNFFTKTNNNLSKISNKGSNNNNSSTFTTNNKSSLTLGNKTNISFDKNEYLLTLDNLKDQIRYNQRRNRLYFKSNDYGCELSKDKYNYITKNFFN